MDSQFDLEGGWYIGIQPINHFENPSYAIIYMAMPLNQLLWPRHSHDGTDKWEISRWRGWRFPVEMKLAHLHHQVKFTP